MLENSSTRLTRPSQQLAAKHWHKLAKDEQMNLEFRSWMMKIWLMTAQWCEKIVGGGCCCPEIHLCSAMCQMHISEGWVWAKSEGNCSMIQTHKHLINFCLTSSESHFAAARVGCGGFHNKTKYFEEEESLFSSITFISKKAKGPTGYNYQVSAFDETF